jgi:N-acetylmuramoyl-L-alanine amidase
VIAAAVATVAVLAGQTVVLDPGHNGANASHPKRINRQVDIGQGMRKACDTTGTATAAGYSESAYTLAVARETARILRRHGAEVILTRDDNAGVGPCITRRARIGNREEADAAISIHADGGPESGRGFHVIRPTRIEGLTDDIYADSRRLGRVLRDAYEQRTGLPRSTYVGGLVARDDLGGLRLSDVPKVFIETANMRNAADARKVESRRFRKRIARGIAEGVIDFLSP